jgi:hypothetical protein
MKDAADEHIYAINKLKNNEYISQATWQLIEDREAKRINGDWDAELALNTQIKNAARKDKKKCIIDQLAEC